MLALADRLTLPGCSRWQVPRAKPSARVSSTRPQRVCSASLQKRLPLSVHTRSMCLGFFCRKHAPLASSANALVPVGTVTAPPTAPGINAGLVGFLLALIIFRGIEIGLDVKGFLLFFLCVGLSLLLTLRRPASEDQNPFTKWSFVVIPDCTGDQHIGNRSYTYDAGDAPPLIYSALHASRTGRLQRVRLAAMPTSFLPITASPCIAHREADAKRQPRAGKESCITVHHRGGVNTGMAMDWLFDSFPVLEEVMVIGAPINKDAAADGANPLFKRYADFKLSPYSHATGSEGAAFWGKFFMRTGGSRVSGRSSDWHDA